MKLRRATPEDADFVAGLLDHEEVEPFLSAHRGREREDVLERIVLSQREPRSVGVFVIEAEGRPAGMMEFWTFNERSRIARPRRPRAPSGLPRPAARRTRPRASCSATSSLDLGFHRLQLEIYGFNERAIAHAERVGFIREGAKRNAYRRHGEWADGVLYALVREDLGLPPAVDFLYEYVARHNQGVRTGDWEPLEERFAEDAVLEFEGVAGRGRSPGVTRSSPPIASGRRTTRCGSSPPRRYRVGVEAQLLVGDRAGPPGRPAAPHLA